VTTLHVVHIFGVGLESAVAVFTGRPGRLARLRSSAACRGSPFFQPLKGKYNTIEDGCGVHPGARGMLACLRWSAACRPPPSCQPLKGQYKANGNDYEADRRSVSRYYREIEKECILRTTTIPVTTIGSMCPPAGSLLSDMGWRWMLREPL
jgi:hypothetical protein